MSNTERFRCPYADCGFEGTEAQVDDHRTSGVHDDQPQAGGNLRAGGSGVGSRNRPAAKG